MALEIKNFSKKYKRNSKSVVSNINFTVKPGEFHGFIGANGAGKTTIIKSIIGAYAKFDGEVKIFGLKNTSLSAKKRLGYIPEIASFPKNFSTLKYLTYMAYISGLEFKNSETFALEKINELGLTNIMHRSPNTFSSGQKKQVLLAQALITDPDIIVMDEPAANLDPKARTEFFDKLKILRNKGKSIFIASHILSELDRYIDSVTIIDGGKIVFTGNIERNKKTINYIIELEDFKDKSKVEKILESKNLKFNFENNIFNVTFNDKKTPMELIFDISKSNISIIEFRKTKKTLQEIYSNFISSGSTETDSTKGVSNE